MTLLNTVRSFLNARATKTYLVGGAVRDMLLGRDTHDIDVSVQGNAADLARAGVGRLTERRTSLRRGAIFRCVLRPRLFRLAILEALSKS